VVDAAETGAEAGTALETIGAAAVGAGEAG